MSIPFSLDQLTCIRDDARRLVARAADHQLDLEAVVRTAETDLTHAEAALSHALAGVGRTEAQLQRLLSAHVRRASESTEAARRACLSGREQQVTAGRLLSRLDDGPSDESRTAPHGMAVLVGRRCRRGA